MLILGQAAIKQLLANSSLTANVRTALGTLASIIVCESDAEFTQVAPVKYVGVIRQPTGSTSWELWTNTNDDLTILGTLTTLTSYWTGVGPIPVGYTYLNSLSKTISGAYTQYRGIDKPDNTTKFRHEDGLLYYQRGTNNLYIYDALLPPSGGFRLLTGGGGGAGGGTKIFDVNLAQVYDEDDVVYIDYPNDLLASGVYRWENDMLYWTEIRPVQFTNGVACTIPPGGYMYVPLGASPQWSGVYRNLDFSTSLTVHNFQEIQVEIAYGKLEHAAGAGASGITLFDENIGYSVGDRVFYPTIGNYSVFYVCRTPIQAPVPPQTNLPKAPGQRADDWFLLANKSPSGAVVVTERPIIGAGNTDSPITLEPPTQAQAIIGKEYVMRARYTDDGSGNPVLDYYWSEVV